MSDSVTTQRELTLAMCKGFLRGKGASETEVAIKMAEVQRTWLTSREPAWVRGLRGAIAVGAGTPVDQIKPTRVPRSQRAA